MEKNNYTYDFRLNELRSEKMKQTTEKQKVIRSFQDAEREKCALIKSLKSFCKNKFQ